MIVSKANIFLYTGFTATASESFAAKSALDAAGVEYTNLHYADSSQHEDVFAAISSWFPESPPVTSFPFLVYDERHDDYSVYRRIIRGAEGIIASASELLAT
jgi:hypothetical protein